ncbi:MAG TPA: TolC family protein [Gemmatimonadales bacterium]|nr:TolC family protein [Gemmatimonadales bacterium]
MSYRSFGWMVPCLLAASLRSAPLRAQQPTAAMSPAAATPAVQPVTMTLADALSMARQNSPVYRQAVNNEGPANWSVRNAYAALLPGASVSGGMGYTGAGQSTFGGSTFNQTSPSLSSNYFAGFTWRLDGSVLTAPALQKANRRATEDDITNAGITLKTSITTQYLTVLAAVAQVGVAERQVSRNADFLQLAQARLSAGQATLIDVRQAQVTKSQSDLALLRARQAANEAKLELFRQIGITPPAPLNTITLTDTFPVDSLPVALADLQTSADEMNPTLRAAESRQAAAVWSVRASKSAFLPSLNFNAGWSGFTQQFTNTNLLLNQAYGGALGNVADCEYQNAIASRLTDTLPYPNQGLIANCNTAFGLNAGGTALNDTVAQQIRNANNVFPFKFQTQPFQASVSISLPIFTGFSRHLHLSQAEAQRDDADETVRAAKLQVHADVQAKYLALQTAWQAITVQRSAQEFAQDQVQLAEGRFRIGSGTSLELADAENSLTAAEAGYINSVYDYQKAIAALEAAVGRPIR